MSGRRVLTEREQQILELAVRGLSDYRIARRLHCCPSSVGRSRKSALRKLREAEADLTWAKEVFSKDSEESISSNAHRRI